jgi:hypothetical protein
MFGIAGQLAGQSIHLLVGFHLGKLIRGKLYVQKDCLASAVKIPTSSTWQAELANLKSGDVYRDVNGQMWRKP